MPELSPEYLPEPGQIIYLQTQDASQSLALSMQIRDQLDGSPVFSGTPALLDADGFWCRKPLGLLSRLRHLDRVLVSRSGRKHEQDAPPLALEARFLLENLGFAGLSGTPVPRLEMLDASGRRLAAWAQAVFERPSLILAPEPFRDLDESGKAALSRFLPALCRDAGVAIVLVSPASALAGTLAGRTTSTRK